jgi:hypothetical protein
VNVYETKDPDSKRIAREREISGGPDVLAMLWDLSNRFSGVDLQFRRTTTCSAGQWPAPWRARMLTSKNERTEYRITVYGDTAAQAASNLLAAVRRIDEGRTP